MHATNNHSDIILLIKFLLMTFLSDAWMVNKRPCCREAWRCSTRWELLSSCLTVTSLHLRPPAQWSASALSVWTAISHLRHTFKKVYFQKKFLPKCQETQVGCLFAATLWSDTHSAVFVPALKRYIPAQFLFLLPIIIKF